MSFRLSQEEGEYLVRLARETIETRLSDGGKPDTRDAPDVTGEHTGVFVTLNTNTPHRLRGCIGHPYPTMPLVEAVVDAAVSAAVMDPRFPPVTLDEMDEIVVEVSVLTPPEEVVVDEHSEYLERVEVERDGLIIGRGMRRGLLLPQVATDWGWDAEEFLSQCCIKAGLPPDSWLLPGTEVQKFQAIIYAEESPRGPVKRVELE